MPFQYKPMFHACTHQSMKICDNGYKSSFERTSDTQHEIRGYIQASTHADGAKQHKHRITGHSKIANTMRAHAVRLDF